MTLVTGAIFLLCALSLGLAAEVRVIMVRLCLMRARGTQALAKICQQLLRQNQKTHLGEKVDKDEERGLRSSRNGRLRFAASVQDLAMG